LCINALVKTQYLLLFYYIPATENEKVGLEDVTWVKCLKSLGTLPNLPLFQILHDYDLSEEDDTVSEESSAPSNQPDLI
jgi:hypothetical protein